MSTCVTNSSNLYFNPVIRKINKFWSYTHLCFDKICFLHVDLNNAKPEVEAIKFFWDKIVTSGIILLDDYAYSKQYHLQKQAIDKIGCTLNFSVITLPTGQGLIIKP